MRGFPALEKSQSHRVRRWDALVLGGALPGLIASIALARRGCRVLMLEDSRTARSYAGLREPFHLCGAGAEGILGAALRGLGLPLIDQRRFRTTPEPLQVVTPEARIRLDAAAGAAAELARWGLASAELAQTLMESLETAARLEREALLGPEIVQTGRRRAFGWARGRATDPKSQRGVPEALEFSDARPPPSSNSAPRYWVHWATTGPPRPAARPGPACWGARWRPRSGWWAKKTVCGACCSVAPRDST